MTGAKTRGIIVILLSLCAYGLSSTTIYATDSWYNTSWQYRKKLIFDNSTQSENLTNFPVLVKLTSSRFDFTLAQSAGQDIRFADSDGITLLPYEIESYDSSSSTANIWVKVPQVDASSSTDYIYMYYGNSGVADGQSASGVWDSNFVGVWHLDESTGNFLDSTDNNQNSTTYTVATRNSPGKIGGSVSLNGTSNGIRLGATGASSAMLRPSPNITLEAWVNAGTSSSYQTIFAHGYSRYGLWILATGELEGRFWNGSAVKSVDSTDTLTPNTWNHLVFTYDNNIEKVYINGDLAGSSSIGTNTITYRTDWYLWLGNEFGIEGYVNGTIDESRISKTARSASWIAADYKVGNDTFISSFDTASADSVNISRTTDNTSFTVSWTTTHGGSTQLEYGTTTSYGSTTDLISLDEGVTQTSTATIRTPTCIPYHFRIKNSTKTGAITYSQNYSLNSGGCPVVSSSSDTSTYSYTPQIPKVSAEQSGGVFSSAVDSNTQGQKIFVILEPHTFSFDAFLSSRFVENINTFIPKTMDFKINTNNSNVLGANSNSNKYKPTANNNNSNANIILAGGSILGIKTTKGIYWQVGNVQEIWYKAYAPAADKTPARIIPDIQEKPSIVALSFKDLDLIPPGQPRFKFNPTLLKLAYSTDGSLWKILPSSVVDITNHTVAALHKVGGYYMVVGR